MSPHYLIAILALLFPLIAAARDQNGGSAIPWKPLENINDPHVTEIANFAVTTHNLQDKKNLVFQKVTKGFYHKEVGTLYRLVIRVKNDKSVLTPTADYEAVVLEKRWAEYKKLVSFVQITK
ncbi:hypothetical protein M0R45_031664 [Rubus argutus]|uniref:Cystatin domain-containing protein n=1 Tax=Rubus argutus TaxID=59490 RepID=A0AAW1WI95_RUBAR